MKNPTVRDFERPITDWPESVVVEIRHERNVRTVTLDTAAVWKSGDFAAARYAGISFSKIEAALKARRLAPAYGDWSMCVPRTLNPGLPQ